MKSKALCPAMTALSLVAAPTIAAAAPAPALTPVARTPVSTPLTQRAGDTIKDDSALAGGGFLLAALAVVAIGLGIYIAADSNDFPNSP